MKYKTKLISFLLALLVCTATAFAAAPSFTDVPANYWAYNYIEQAAENGWVNGVGNGKYAPEDKVTGAEFVTMVSRVFYQHTMQDPKAAVVLVRMNIRVNDPSAEEPSIPGSTTPEQPTTEPEEPTTEPETPSANYGPVGTMSDTPVTLSYETYKPVTDYWSSAPADIRAITDQEAYNCAVQTLKDQDVIRDPSVIKNDINPYYITQYLSSMGRRMKLT